MPLPLLLALSGTPAASASPPPRPLVVGHRGARARLPENTVPAVRHALDAGADAVEVDVRLSSDDVPVLFHDATLRPDVCRGPGGRAVPPGVAVRSLTFAALRRYSCGAVADPRFPLQRPSRDARIPSLGELLDLLAAPGPVASRPPSLFLELKHEAEGASPPVSRARFARIVVDLLAERGLAERTLVLSFDLPLLREVRAAAPGLGVLPLVDRDEDLAALARREGAGWVGPRHTLLTAASVDALHAAGIRVFAWTANAPGEQDRLARIGVDAIGTDDPAALVARWGATR
jgi:glycerophosphoryl diester phosphodiesterase